MGLGIWHPKLIFWRCFVECLWRSRVRSQTENGCIVRNVLPVAVSVFHRMSPWKCCGAQWLIGFAHILFMRAFGALERIDHVLEWVHVGCKTLMVSFGWVVILWSMHMCQQVLNLLLWHSPIPLEICLPWEFVLLIKYLVRQGQFGKFKGKLWGQFLTNYLLTDAVVSGCSGQVPVYHEMW